MLHDSALKQFETFFLNFTV